MKAATISELSKRERRALVLPASAGSNSVRQLIPQYVPNFGKHSLGTRDYQEALEYLRQLDTAKAIELGIASAPMTSPTSELSIAAGWDLFLAHCERPQIMGGVSRGTSRRYRTHRKTLELFCKQHHIQTRNAFGKRQLLLFAKARTDKNLKPRTIHFDLDLVRTINKWLVAEKHLPAELRIHCPLKKPQGTDRYCFSPEQVRAMLELCQLTPSLDWLYSIVLGLSHTGMRIGELAAVRRSDIDLQKGFVRVADERSQKTTAAEAVRTTKGKRSRLIPLHVDLKDYLKGLSPLFL